MLVRSMEFADVVSEALQFGLGEFVAPCRSEKGGKGFLQNDVICHIGRDFPALQCGFIHKGKLPGPGEPEKLGQPFQNTNITGRRIHAAFHFAPVARVKPDLLAEVPQGHSLLKAQGFDGIVKHIHGVFVVELYHKCQPPA